MIDWLGLLPALSLPGAALPVQAGGSFWLPPPRSTAAPLVDQLFYFLLDVSALFFILIVSLMILFVILYRQRPERQPGTAPSHNTALEVVWTAVPVIIVIVIFYQGFAQYLDMRIPPRNAREIHVIAQKWQWFFTYANGHPDPNLHVPVDEPVRLIMTSRDVIHSLYIPSFRLKMDVVPGRYTTAWFDATEPGEYGLYCAEYCGTGHSDMAAKVVVHRPGEFEKWLQEAGNVLKNMTPVEAGKLLYETRGCRNCHSLDGTAATGPSFKGIFGRTHTFSNAPPAEVDENYIRESILEPGAKVREGFQDVMPTFRGILNDDEITALVEFIKSLK